MQAEIKVSRVEWEYTTPQIYNGTRTQLPPMISGIRALECLCTACQRSFRATKAKTGAGGTFYPTIGHVTVKCPSGEHGATLAVSGLPGYN